MNNPNSPLVPTDDPGATEREYEARGFKVEQIYVGKHNPGKCGGCLYAIRFWRPAPPEQPDLI